MSYAFHFRNGEMVSMERIDEPTPAEMREYEAEGKRLQKKKANPQKRIGKSNNAQVQSIKSKEACQSPEEAEARALAMQEEQYHQEEMERKEREKFEHPDFSPEDND